MPNNRLRTKVSKTWGLYWTLWKQNRNMVYARLKSSAVGAPNQGGIFTVDEMKTLTQWSWLPDCGISFVNWLLLRFQCITMLFAALRQENFDRWRRVGSKGLHFDYNHLDDEGKIRPICTSEYPRVKLKNGCNPYKVEETQQMVIVCFCKGQSPVEIIDRTRSFDVCPKVSSFPDFISNKYNNRRTCGLATSRSGFIYLDFGQNQSLPDW